MQKVKTLPKSFTLNGVTRPILAWLDTYGIDRNTFYARINRGWSIDRAIKESLDPQGQSKKHLTLGDLVSLVKDMIENNTPFTYKKACVALGCNEWKARDLVRLAVKEGLIEVHTLKSHTVGGLFTVISLDGYGETPKPFTFRKWKDPESPPVNKMDEYLERNRLRDLERAKYQQECLAKERRNSGPHPELVDLSAQLEEERMYKLFTGLDSVRI